MEQIKILPVSYTHLDVYKRQGEMRSAAESLSAAESSRTGHTVCTTIHSNSCNSTYRRMMTLAKRKYNMDDSILMQIMVCLLYTSP